MLVVVVAEVVPVAASVLILLHWYCVSDKKYQIK
jgi:hypothetical protein